MKKTVKPKTVKSKPVQKKRTSKPAPEPTLKEMLAQTAKYLNTPLYSRFWDVLSALRGPDNEHIQVEVGGVKYNSEYVKSATTGVIRMAALGHTQVMVVTCHDREDYAEMRKQLSLAAEAERKAYWASSTQSTMELQHFTDHAKQAFKALGLKWDEVNS